MELYLIFPIRLYAVQRDSFTLTHETRAKLCQWCVLKFKSFFYFVALKFNTTRFPFENRKDGGQVVGVTICAE